MNIENDQDQSNRIQESMNQNVKNQEETNHEDFARDQKARMKLSWVDLVFALVGIAILYIGLGFATAWVAGWWPYERVLLYVNGFMTQGLFLLVIWSLTRIRGWKWTDFGWSSLEGRKYLGSVVTFYLLTWIINILYGAYLLQKGFTPPETDVYTQLLGNVTLFTFILNLLLAGIIAPIMEETLFRGIIFGSLQTYLGKWTAAAVSAAIFSGLHFQVYGFFPRFVLGMVLAYLYMKHKSIYPSMAMHALNNIVALCLVAFAGGL